MRAGLELRERQVPELHSLSRGWGRGPWIGSGDGVDKEVGRKQGETYFSESKKNKSKRESMV